MIFTWNKLHHIIGMRILVQFLRVGIEHFRIKGGGIEFLVFKIIKGCSDRLISCSMLYYAISNLLQFAWEIKVICALENC